MNLEELTSLVGDGRFFGVRFIKRTDGSVRNMCARVGVSPETYGLQPRNWSPAERGLLQVWDVHKKGFRLIPAESVLEVRVRGRRITPDL